MEISSFVDSGHGRAENGNFNAQSHVPPRLSPHSVANLCEHLHPPKLPEKIALTKKRIVIARFFPSLRRKKTELPLAPMPAFSKTHQKLEHLNRVKRFLQSQSDSEEISEVSAIPCWKGKLSNA
jgi:hypothetical protein